MKLLLIDDHQLFGKSIKMVLESDDEIDSVTVLSQIDSLNYQQISNYYDIVLLDINLTHLYESDGLDLARTILEHDQGCKIVILTGYNRQMYEHQALELGAYGFVDKSVDPDKLITILKEVNKGRKYFHENTLEILDLLTQREVKILDLVRQGFTIEDICKELFISKRTVSNHLGNIFSKLNTANRQEAIIKAEKLGYFSPD